MDFSSITMIFDERFCEEIVEFLRRDSIEFVHISRDDGFQKDFIDKFGRLVSLRDVLETVDASAGVLHPFAQEVIVMVICAEDGDIGFFIQFCGRKNFSLHRPIVDFDELVLDVCEGIVPSEVLDEDDVFYGAEGHERLTAMEDSGVFLWCGERGIHLAVL